MQVAVLPPSVVVTVIVAVPAFFAVTTPEEDTVATAVLFDDQVTDLSEAFDGFTVAVSAWVSPSVRASDVLSSVTPVTGMTGALTVTVHVADLLPSVVVTVIVAVPAFFAVTTPADDTVATSGLSDDQRTFLNVASDGLTVAVRVSVSPSVKLSKVLSSVTPVTPIAWTVTSQLATSDPTEAVIMVFPGAWPMTLP